MVMRAVDQLDNINESLVVREKFIRVSKNNFFSFYFIRRTI